MSENNQKINIEEITRQQIDSFEKYIEIECPNGIIGHTSDSHNICFAGDSQAEDFIREFTDKMIPYLKNNVYWRRDFGMWHTQMDFKNSSHSVVMTVMMKGDSKNLSKFKQMENYSMFIACAIFDQ